jgi:hypothetical protein
VVVSSTNTAPISPSASGIAYVRCCIPNVIDFHLSCSSWTHSVLTSGASWSGAAIRRAIRWVSLATGW